MNRMYWFILRDTAKSIERMKRATKRFYSPSFREMDQYHRNMIFATMGGMPIIMELPFEHYKDLYIRTGEQEYFDLMLEHIGQEHPE